MSHSTRSKNPYKTPAVIGATALGLLVAACAPDHVFIPDDAPSADTDGSDEAASRQDASDNADASDAPLPEDDAGQAPNCVTDLSNIGVGDFTIRLRVTTGQGGRVALVSQRSTCGTQSFWELRLFDGAVTADTDDESGHYALLSSTAIVNDSRPHDIVVARVAQTLTIYVDGSPSGLASSGAFLGPLAPLAIGTNVCTGSDGTVAFTGTWANLCISKP